MDFQNMQNTLQKALERLYHEDQQVRNSARNWLLKFQGRVEAWKVSDSLLHDANSNLETRIFCSQTLKTKVQRDFEELPPAAFFSLRDSLKNLLEKFSEGPSKVRMEICIAMSALAVHVPAQEWEGGGILDWLGVELGSNPNYSIGLLELLRVLPQGASSNKIAVHPERRREFQKELVSSAELSFGFLASCLSFEELHEQVLNAFASWLRLSLGIPAASLASNSLVLAAISGLNSEQLFEAAVNAICELIHYTVYGSPGGLEEQMPLVQVLVPHVMGLRGRFLALLMVALIEKEGNQGGESGIDQAYMEDDKIVKGMARLFAEMGNSYVELIANDSAESMMIVDALVGVTSHPEYDISSMTFNFWHSLQTTLTNRERYCSFGNRAAIASEMERRLTFFRPKFEELVSLVSFRVMYPQNHEDLSKKDISDFKWRRHAVGNILKDATSILGRKTTYKILKNHLFRAASTAGNRGSRDWRSEEAKKYCIHVITRAVPKP